MTAFAEELEAELSVSRGSRCGVCVFLGEQSEEHADAWDRQLAKPVDVLGHLAIARAINRRTSAQVSDKIVKRHREQGHTYR